MATLDEGEHTEWVHSSKVSIELVEEYEKFAGVITESKYQVISHSIVSTDRIDRPPGEPSNKKARKDWDIGYVCHSLIRRMICYSELPLIPISHLASERSGSPFTGMLSVQLSA